MPDQPDLFAEPKPARKKPGTHAPDKLTPPQIRKVEDWAERTVPWLRREALESFESLESYVEEITEWWQGEGRPKADWVKTIQNRIRKVERRRLTDLAKNGSQSARQALRDPIAWAKAYDARAKASTEAARATGPDEPIRPKGGAAVVQLGARRGGPGH